jgi:hypothetical protein
MRTQGDVPGKLLQALAYLFGAVILLIGGSLLRGWVLTKIWLWFAVPVLGVRPLSIVSAIGLSLLVSMFHYPVLKPKNDQDDEDDPGDPSQGPDRIMRVAALVIFPPLTTLLVAWLWHQFA